MRLVKNVPLSTSIIEELISDKDDMYLVWPLARFPFDHDQWKEKLTKDERNISLLIYDNDLLIGHGALLKSKNEDEFAVSFLYIIPELRSKGYGEMMINKLEKYAKDNLGTKSLCLVVRTYNPRGIKCYTKCGFKEISKEDTLISMNKAI